ncbi:15788_t:CDS:2 [Dentiscutata erythropus]|uniref:15788_t:CDS:1 n=1 Tax=Dentiscutata erythropus TaxID=1348616 RepID=A0A9N9FLH6_9GLOM|nr:15788_t:CDS:2 [Dentiscutata erythropus]
MIKFGILTTLATLFLVCVVSSCHGPVPTSIGNTESPNVTIPSDITPPDGNCFKFSLFTSGYLLYTCNKNKTWSAGSGIGSIIPKDTSSLVVTTSATHPAPDSRDLPWALGKASNNKGDGAFKDITYLVRVNTCGGVAPDNSLCGTTYPTGYNYS